MQSISFYGKRALNTVCHPCRFVQYNLCVGACFSSKKSGGKWRKLVVVVIVRDTRRGKGYIRTRKKKVGEESKRRRRMNGESGVKSAMYILYFLGWG